MAYMVVDHFESVHVGDDDADGPHLLLFQLVDSHSIIGAAAQSGKGVVTHQLFKPCPVALARADVCVQAHNADGLAACVAVSHIAPAENPCPGAVAALHPVGAFKAVAHFGVVDEFNLHGNDVVVIVGVYLAGP